MASSSTDEQKEMEAAYIALAYIIEYFSAEILPELHRFSAVLIRGTNHSMESVRASALFALRPYLRLEPVLAKMGSPLLDSGFEYMLNSVVRNIRRSSNLLDAIEHPSSSCDADDILPRGEEVVPFRGHALRRYQWDAVLWMARLWTRGFGGAILADEQGLGKTLTALTAIVFRRLWIIANCKYRLLLLK